MKKIRFLLCCSFVMLFVQIVCAQSSSVLAANRKTAQRCLNLAENCMLNGDWQNALSQAELGLSYDDTVSDLLYVKATAQSNLDYTKADVLKTIEVAFEKDNWINYSKNGARILYADLLSETGLYDESIAVLDMAPLLYSADSEFIRIKDYYRMGTADSIQQARARLNSSRRIYPKDNRFRNLFFLFEMSFMNYAELSGTIYEIPDIVQIIADYYISQIPDYNDEDVETEIIALMFAQGEQQTRLLKAVGEKNQNHPLFAYAGLKTGIISEEKAVNLFFGSSANQYHLNILESFSTLLKDEDLRAYFADKLTSFNGELLIDNDLDLIYELKVVYDRGRAQYIRYDRNNDGVLDLYAVCDFGTPLAVNFPVEKIDLFYDDFPCVGKAVDNNNGSVYHFLNYDYAFNPFEMIVDPVFKTYYLDFYIPLLDTGIACPDEYILAKRASTVEIRTRERLDSKVVYTVFDGRPVFATFISQNYRYAYATIEPGCPFVRYVDYDNDEVYETAETFDIENSNRYVNDEEMALIKNIFGENTFSERLFLRKIEIDRNSDTIIEFSENYLGYNGKISSWDTDGNGIVDYEYIRYPDDEGDLLVEETIIYNRNGLEFVALKNVDGKPVSLKYNGKEMSVYNGSAKNYYWIETPGSDEFEKILQENIKAGVTDGAVQVVQINDEIRISVIKIGQALYCKIIPPSEVIDVEE